MHDSNFLGDLFLVKDIVYPYTLIFILYQVIASRAQLVQKSLSMFARGYVTEYLWVVHRGSGSCVARSRWWSSSYTASREYWMTSSSSYKRRDTTRHQYLFPSVHIQRHRVKLNICFRHISKKKKKKKLKVYISTGKIFSSISNQDSLFFSLNIASRLKSLDGSNSNQSYLIVSRCPSVPSFIYIYTHFLLSFFTLVSR